MALNTALKMAILESGYTQQEIADLASRLLQQRDAGKLHESQLSKITRGHVDPSDDVKKALARVLKRPIDQIFPEAVAS